MPVTIYSSDFNALSRQLHLPISMIWIKWLKSSILERLVDMGFVDGYVDLLDVYGYGWGYFYVEEGR